MVLSLSNQQFAVPHYSSPDDGVAVIPDYWAHLTDGSVSVFKFQLYMMAYITSIWQKVCFPVIGQTAVSFNTFADPGPYYLRVLTGFVPVAGVNVLVDSIPPDVDLEFGQPEIAYLGKCRFVYEGAVPMAQGGPPIFGPLHWVNAQNSCHFADNPTAIGFQLLLKKGLTATVQLAGTDHGDVFKWGAEGINPMTGSGFPG